MPRPVHKYHQYPKDEEQIENYAIHIEFKASSDLEARQFADKLMLAIGPLYPQMGEMFLTDGDDWTEHLDEMEDFDPARVRVGVGHRVYLNEEAGTISDDPPIPKDIVVSL